MAQPQVSPALESLRDTRLRPRPPVSVARLMDASFDDLTSDFEELHYLTSSSSTRLGSALAELRSMRRHVRPGTLEVVEEQMRSLIARHDALMQLVDAGARLSRTTARTARVLDDLTRRKLELADALRPVAALAGAAVTASDWQSPSFRHAGRSMAGRHTGRITEHVDDYKRDRHPDAAGYETSFLKEYVDAPPGIEVRALMTSCGMSAFTTILGHLADERGSVLVGRGLYHECKDILMSDPLPWKVVEVDDLSVSGFHQAIQAHRPRAVFLDSLCNARGIPMVDLTAVIAALDRECDSSTHVVVDNTGLSCAFQPLEQALRGSRRVQPIVFESLTKLAQFGFDRVTAGMIVALRGDAAGLSLRREHLGTNVPDSSVHVLPPPNRRRLEARLKRLGRNALILAGRLETDARTGSLIASVAYPGLPGHPSYDIASKRSFAGPFFQVNLVAPYDNPACHRRFIDRAIDEAVRRGVDLTAGATFGLNVTRLYATGATSKHGKPFLRISPGTEHRLQVEEVADVLCAAARLGSRPA